MKRAKTSASPRPSAIRCAIYTRKSTEEGLEKEFNSLDAQREAGEAYIRSQQHEGWTLVPTRYDDGGFTGGNMERPALKRLMADIEAGAVDCVVVYKVDRLSRSLLDFARMMDTFERRTISFVSVTQQFNTGSSMGRLVLNVLLSFAEFERSIISERTRDKIAAARRKGKWSGGMPLLGYGVGQDTKLVVNEAEAERVRAIFRMYLDLQSMTTMLRELDRRGWRNKRWTNRAGDDSGGGPFTKASLHRLLTNVAYVGQLRYRDEIHDGEHAAIVDPETFRSVGRLLNRNRGSANPAARNRHGALLRGLLRCSACDAAMSHAHTSRGAKHYRYYVCSNAQRRGWAACPSKSVPAGEIERVVVGQIKRVGHDPNLLQATVREVVGQRAEQLRLLEDKREPLAVELARLKWEAAGIAIGDAASVGRLRELHERLRQVEDRLAAVDDEVSALEREPVAEAEISAALGQFEPLWETLEPRERVRVIHMLVARVDFDGAAGNLAITFQPTGLRSLASEAAQGTPA